MDDQQPTSGDSAPAEWAVLAGQAATAESLVALTGADPTGMTGAALVDAIVVSEKALSLLAGRQMRMLAALAVPFVAGDPMRLAAVLARKSCLTGDDDPDQVAHYVPEAAASLASAEVAAALRIPCRTAGIRVAEARAMTGVLAPTLDALERGTVDRVKARVIADHCQPLTPEQTRDLQDLVLPGAGELTTSELREVTGQAVIIVDPDGAENRHQEAAARRDLLMQADPDGMATLKAHLPADGAVKIFQVSDLLATGTAGTPGDSRGIGARRVDALVDIADHLLTHGFVDLSDYLGTELPDHGTPTPRAPRPNTDTDTTSASASTDTEDASGTPSAPDADTTGLDTDTEDAAGTPSTAEAAGTPCTAAAGTTGLDTDTDTNDSAEATAEPTGDAESAAIVDATDGRTSDAESASTAGDVNDTDAPPDTDTAGPEIMVPESDLLVDTDTADTADAPEPAHTDIVDQAADFAASPAATDTDTVDQATTAGASTDSTPEDVVTESDLLVGTDTADTADTADADTAHTADTDIVDQATAAGAGPDSTGTGAGIVDQVTAAGASPDSAGEGAAQTGTATTATGSATRRGGNRVFTRQGRRPHLSVTIGLSTLAGLDNLPGSLAGFGAIPAGLARSIAASAATINTLVTDPDTGRVTAAGALTYRPTQELRDRIAAVLNVCQFPSCRQPAWRCDNDHRDSFNHEHPEQGGKTNSKNIGPLCKRHHLIKHHSDWRIRMDPNRHVLEFTSPTGHQYRKPGRQAAAPGLWVSTAGTAIAERLDNIANPPSTLVRRPDDEPTPTSHLEDLIAMIMIRHHLNTKTIEIDYQPGTTWETADLDDPPPF